MNQLAEQVERFGFRAKRLSYGITLDDISKKCGLAISTISAYERFSSKYTETRTRDENAITIDRALNDIINEKIQETFTGAVTSQKEEKVVEEYSLKKQIEAVNVNPDYDRKIIFDKINKYCKESNITVTEFCEMCDITSSTFAASTIKRHPYLYGRTIYKICKATGWSEDQLTGKAEIKTIDEKKPEIVKGDPNPVRVITYDRDEVNSLSNLSHDGNVKIEDKKYTYQEGKYYLEYTIIRKVKRMITKEQFMNEIQKEEN